MADQNFITKIRTAESEANRLIEQARELSGDQRKEARQAADKLVDEAYKSAQLEHQDIMSEAEAQYRHILAAEPSETEEYAKKSDADSFRRAADIVAERIVMLLGDF